MKTNKNLDFPHILLVGNGAYTNRGCEAIVRGTMNILRRQFGEQFRVTAVYFEERDVIRNQVNSESDPLIEHISIISPRWTPNWIYNQFRRRCLGCNNWQYPYLHSLSTSAVCAMEIGGDNYSLDYGIPMSHVYLDRQLMENKVSIILWGASVGPFDKEPEFAKEIFAHLQRLKGILVREDASFKYLVANGIKENVHCVADPAFVMEPVQPKQDKIGAVINDSMIGINLSPLMARFVTGGNLLLWRDKCENILKNIIKNTEYTILLIPHVSKPNNSDFLFMQKLKDDLAKHYSTRILITTDNLNAAETKWVISKCKAFIGARTHSTIAAMSSYVPTLSLAYSIKALGLNKEVFGTQDYCIQPEQINAQNIVNKLGYLLDNQTNIHNHLVEVMPHIRELAFKAGAILKQHINDGVK